MDMKLYAEQLEKLKNFTLPSSFNRKSFPPSFDFAKWSKMKIAVVGKIGSGKSSFIGTLERIFRGDENFNIPSRCPIQNGGGEGTLILQDYLSEFSWRLLDTRGFSDYSPTEIKELINIIDGKIHSGELIYRKTDINLCGDLKGEMGEISLKIDQKRL